MPSISACDALEILKAETKKLPSKPPQASLQQEKDKLKELCIKIFATRRKANAERSRCGTGMELSIIQTEKEKQLCPTPETT